MVLPRIMHGLGNVILGVDEIMKAYPIAFCNSISTSLVPALIALNTA